MKRAKERDTEERDVKNIPEVLLRKADGTEMVKPTFEQFLTHEELTTIAAKTPNVLVCNFNTFLGDTIKEKYESLFVIICKETNLLLQRGAAGYFWIVSSPDVSSIFETVTTGYEPWPYAYTPHLLNGQYPMGLAAVDFCGVLNCKWRLYKNAAFPANQIIIGANDKLEDFDHYTKLKIANFIII
jgi:hypothetical protein